MEAKKEASKVCIYFFEYFFSKDKPVELWTKVQVQDWFHQNDEFTEFGSKFKGLSGKSLAGLTEQQLQKELGNLQGSALYNAVAALKKGTVYWYVVDIFIPKHPTS